MSQAELNYKFKVEGQEQLKQAAAAQQTLHQNTEKSSAVIDRLGDSFKEAAQDAQSWSGRTASAAATAAQQFDALGSKVAGAKEALDQFYQTQQQAQANKGKKNGEFDEPDVAAKKRADAVRAANQAVDQAVQKQQLSELSGIDKIEARRRILLRDLGLDAELRTKINALMDREVVNEQRLAAARAKALAQKEAEARAEAARKKAQQEAAALPNAIRENGRLGSQLLSASQGSISSLPQLGANIAESFGLAGIAAAGIAYGLYRATAAAVQLLETSAANAKELTNTADRVGLSVTQVQKLSAEAEIAGVHFATIEQSARTLGNALEDPTGAGKKAVEQLDKIGVSLYKNNGGLKDEGQLLIDVLEKLSGITSVSERAVALQALFARGGKELEPLIQRHEELRQVVQELGIGMDKDLVPSLAKADDQFRELDLSWKQLKDELAKDIAPIVIPIVGWLKGVFSGNNGQYDQGKQGQLFHFDGNGNLVVDSQKPSTFDAAGAAADLASDLGRPNPLANRQAAVDAYKRQRANTVEGLQERKRELEEQNKKLDFNLQRADAYPLDAAGDAKRAGDAATVKSNQRQIDQIEEKIKALNKSKGEYDHLKSQVENYEKQANEFELTGLEKIDAKYAEILQKIRAYPDLVKRANSAHLGEINARLRSDQAGRIGQTTGLDVARATYGYGPGQEKEAAEAEFETRFAHAREILEVNKNGEQFLKAAIQARLELDAKLLDIDKQRLAIARQNAESIAEAQVNGAAKVAERKAEIAADPFQTGHKVGEQEAEDARYKAQLAQIEKVYLIKKTYETQSAADQYRAIAQIDADTQHQLNNIDIVQKKRKESIQIEKDAEDLQFKKAAALLELQSGPGGEIGIINRIAALKEQIAEKEYADTNNLAELRKKQGEIELDRQQQLLEIQKQQNETVQHAAGDLYSAGLSGGPRGIGQYFQGIATGIGKQVSENIAGIGFSYLQKNKLIPTIGGQQNADGSPNLLGQILAHTPFSVGKGGDPNKQLITSQDSLKTSVDANKEAVQGLTNALTGSSGQPGAAGASGASQSAALVDKFVPGLGTLLKQGGNLINDLKGAPKDLGQIDDSIAGGSVAEDVGGGGGGDGSDLGGAASSSSSANALAGFSWGKAAGTAFGVVAGGLDIFSGLKKGGAKGINQAVGGGLETAAALDPEPISKAALAIGAGISKLVGAFLGDPRQQRANEETRELANAKYNRPDAYDVTVDSSGKAAQRDYKGNIEVLKSDPLLQAYTQIYGFDPLHSRQTLSYTDYRVGLAPGPDSRSLSTQTPASSNSTNVYVTVPVTAMDSKSFVDNASKIGDAMVAVMQSTHRFNSDLQNAIKPY